MRKIFPHCIFALFLFIIFLIEFSLLGSKSPILTAFLCSIMVTLATALSNRAMAVAKQKRREKQMSKSHAIKE